MYTRHLTGQAGERLAKQYLVEHGYTVLETNVFLRYTEIDIICRKGTTIHFFEVKTRRSVKYGTPIEAVSQRKIQQLQRAGVWYVTTRKLSYTALAVGIVGILYKQTNSSPEITCIPTVIH